MFREYIDMLARKNGLPPGEWLMKPGMGFGDDRKWWAQGRRSTSHNGLDLRAYMESRGGIIYMDGNRVVPAAASGEVVNTGEDFLGQSVFVLHGPDGSGGSLVSAYGHIVPAEGIRPGARLRGGDIIGRLSEYDGMPVPAHLHFSLIRFTGRVPGVLAWEELEASDNVMFLGPTGTLYS